MSLSCTWYGTCTLKFNKWETNSIAIGGAAFAASRGVPWYVAVFIERFADYATAHGYCLSISYRPALALINPALGITPSYYRC